MDARREIGVMRPGDTFPGVPSVSQRFDGATVIEVGVLAHRVLRSGRRGRIAAVFERSLYAVLDDCWICIGAKDLGSGPLHLLCTGLEPRRFSPGKELMIVDGALLVDDLPFAGLETASVWAPAPAPDWTLHSLRMGLMAVDEVWRLLPVGQGWPRRLAYGPQRGRLVCSQPRRQGWPHSSDWSRPDFAGSAARRVTIRELSH
ncbi:hypothetical protein ACFIOY_36100 [Bradyrhizobium sp. TZ2]